MGDWKPLVFTFAFIIFLGLLVSLVASAFVPVESITTTGMMNDTINLINNGYNFTLNIPILPDVSGTLPFPLPSTPKSFLTTHMTYLGVIPESVLNPILFVCFVALVVGIIALIIP